MVGKSEEQKELIERYLQIYGDSDVGIGRILSKVYVRKLFRRAVPKTDIDVNSVKTESMGNMKIMGLQN